MSARRPPEGFIERETRGYADYLLQQILATLQQVAARLAGLVPSPAGGSAATGAAPAGGATASGSGGTASGGGTSAGGVGTASGGGTPTTPSGEASQGTAQAVVDVDLAPLTVGDGTTATQVVALFGSPPQQMNLSAQVQSDLVGARLEYLDGAMQGLLREVASVTANGIITVDASYGQAPIPGTHFALKQTVRQQASSAKTPIAVTFQSSATANGNGSSVSVLGYSTLVVEIIASGESVGATVTFQFASLSGTFVDATGVNLNGLGTATDVSLTAAGTQQWTLSVAGVDSVQMPISGYSAGEITVQGRLQA